MPRGKRAFSGWQGASLVAITYVYFLIFAQFAFLKRLTTLGTGAHLNSVMAAMAAGGILFSLLGPRLRVWPLPSLRLRAGLLVSAAAALLSLMPLNLAAAVLVAFLLGAGVGITTVTLATHLRMWTGNRNPLFLVGLGTGLGYLICNIPRFFTASAELQSSVAGLLCLAGVGITYLPVAPTPDDTVTSPQHSLSFLRVVTAFTALVWLDSAAFLIIQNTPALKAGTWHGSTHLTTNGLLHLGAALLCVWLLRRRGLGFVLAAAFTLLGSACLLLLDPNRVTLASLFYPVGVSLYSVALVAYPSLLMPASSAAERGLRAGWIYAIAGWSGSAMGIGMAQNLGYVPPLFVLFAGAVVLLPWAYQFTIRRRREVAVTAIAVLFAFCLDRSFHGAGSSIPLSPIERGRQVYISEGCIHCHSQYVRPNSPDVLMWGPVESIEELRRERPPLIGNRRQGPDLAEIGARRSPLWLKAHFSDPAEVSGASIMPSFTMLFRDGRGDDLVAFLESLKTEGVDKHWAAERIWHTSDASIAQATLAEGERCFNHYCATCHSATGPTRSSWKPYFKRTPPDLAVGPFYYVAPSGPGSQRATRLAQIVKFGIPGTDMPGHEYLSDNEVASLSLWLSQIIAQSNQKP